MKTVFITLKDEFVQAARRHDFSAPALLELQTVCDRYDLRFDTLYPGKAPAGMENDFFVAGEKAHDEVVLEALRNTPAVESIEIPPARKLVL